MNRKSKRYDEGGLTAEEKAKKDLFSGKAAPDESDTYAPKTRSFSETGPDTKAKAKEPKASQDDAFPKKDREKEKDEKPARVSSGASGFPLTKKEKEKEEKPARVSSGASGFPLTKREKEKEEKPVRVSSGASGFGLNPREKEKAEKPVRVSSGASGFPTKKKEKAPYEGFKKGGSVSASSRGDGIAQRGKTKGKII
jgi:hypothetical protein